MSTIGLLLLIAEAFQMAAAAPQAEASAQPPRRVAAPLPDSVRIVRDVSGADALAAPIYVVECRIVDPKGVTIALPKVTLCDGEKITMSDTGQETFIVATRTENGATVPVKESITEGTTAEVRVRGLGDDRALVDISVDLRSANANPTETARPVQIHVVSGRAIKAGQLGEKITTDFAAGQGRIEALVTRLANETHPGQVEQ